MFNKLKKILIYGLVSGLLLQTSFALTLLNPQKAQAGNPGDPYKVFINEFVSRPTAGQKEKIEIYNANPAGTDPIDISRWYIADDTTMRVAFGSPEDGTKLNPGEFYVFENNSSTSILNDNGDNIYLWGYDWPSQNGYEYRTSYPETAISETIDTINYGNGDSDTTRPPAQGKSAGRLPDGTDTWHADLYPTLGSINIRDTFVPTSTITYPENNRYYNSLNPITGIEEDTGGSEIDKVEIKIEKKSEVANKYFDGNTWVSTETWNLATISNSWIFNGLNNSFLRDGETYIISSRATDKAGNIQDPVNNVNFTYDVSAPTGTIAINNNATLTSSNLVNLSFTASADTQNMMISNFADFSGANWEIYNATKTSWNLIAGNGNKTVYVKFKDQAGNESAVYSANIVLDSNSTNVVTNNVFVGNNVLFPTPELELDINGLSNAVLTTARYQQNPGINLPTGITAFGKYYEIALNNMDLVTKPFTIKIYYTQTELDQSGISENKLVGLYYFDQTSSTWKLFDNTGVDTNDIIVNGVQYAGYLWTNTDHLTPISAGFDISAPQKPANFTATAKDSEIDLSWEKVTDAKGYFVRYREGTNIDNRVYQTIYLSGADSTSTKATGLKNNTLYEFGIKTIDKYDNESEWAVVVSTPITQATLAVAQTTTLKATTAPSDTLSTTDQGKAAEITTVTPEEGTVKSENGMKTSTRFWITLLILVIAAGAAYGGYYAYQWWMTRPKKEKVKAKKNTPPTPKSPDKGGRW